MKQNNVPRQKNLEPEAQLFEHAAPTQEAPVTDQNADFAEQDSPDAVYCICRSKDETSMIMCDRCSQWFHFKCMGITPEEIPLYTVEEKPFFCPSCTEKNRKSNKKKP